MHFFGPRDPKILKKESGRTKIQVFFYQQPFRGGLEPFSGPSNHNLKISIFAIIFIFFPKKSLFLTLEIKFWPKIPTDMYWVSKL